MITNKTTQDDINLLRSHVRSYFESPKLLPFSFVL